MVVSDIRLGEMTDLVEGLTVSRFGEEGIRHEERKLRLAMTSLFGGQSNRNDGGLID